MLNVSGITIVLVDSASMESRDLTQLIGKSSLNVIDQFQIRMKKQRSIRSREISDCAERTWLKVKAAVREQLRAQSLILSYEQLNQADAKLLKSVLR